MTSRKAETVVGNEGPKKHAGSTSTWEEGRYANFFQIGHNACEFLIEFGQQEGEETVIHTRIYLSPQHARILSDLMLDSIRQYEHLFGRILNLVPKEPDLK